jgi:hypothetical protein
MRNIRRPSLSVRYNRQPQLARVSSFVQQRSLKKNLQFDDR